MSYPTKASDWRVYLETCMKSTEFCCLATVDEDGVWSNPVYFAWDKNFNIYFISKPHSRHMQNILKDSRVSISIYNTVQSTFADVNGIQLNGHAHIITAKDDVYHAYRVYYGRKYPDTSTNPKMEKDAYINDPTWQFVKIIPNHIYYFDTKCFGEKRQEVPLEALGIVE